MKRFYTLVLASLFLALLTFNTKAKKLEVLVNINQSGIEDCMTSLIITPNQQVLVYPNPACDLINIDFNENVSGKVQIINTQGVIIKEIELNNQKNQHIDLDGCKGMLFVRIITQFGRHTEKVIIY